MKERLVIFGTGEIGELAKFYFENDSEFEVVAFCADDEYVREDIIFGLPVVAMSDLVAKYPPEEHVAHVAISYREINRIRERKYNELKKLNYQLATYISSRSVHWKDLKHGDNCFILENQTIQPKVVIGNNVMIWSGNHIGHGTRIEDHVYISSHVVISGNCEIGERSFLGVNAAIKDFVRIGRENFVTMGANVTADSGDGDVHLAGTGTVLVGDSDKAEKIKKKYFRM